VDRVRCCRQPGRDGEGFAASPIDSFTSTDESSKFVISVKSKESGSVRAHRHESAEAVNKSWELSLRRQVIEQIRLRNLPPGLQQSLLDGLHLDEVGNRCCHVGIERGALGFG
jgi:hypothetical protein